MTIEKIQKVNVGEQVFERMKQLILDGEWKPADKLPSESELANRFGVSRVTVRQALQKLNTMGLVETRLGSGTFVKEIDAGSTMQELLPTAYLSSPLDQIMEFRRIIDSESAGLAARRATEEEVGVLRQINSDMIQEYEAGDLKGFARKDSEFHFKIGEISKNPLLIKTNAILQEILRSSMVDFIEVRGYESAIKYHTLIVEAIAKHNEKEAVELVRRHLG